jgi:DNA primase
LRARLEQECGAALEMLFGRPHVATAPPVIKAHDAELATQCLAEEFAKLTARRAVLREIEEAAQDIYGLVDEGLTWRLSQATSARDAAGRSALSDTTDLGEDRPGLLRQLYSMSDQIGQKKLR